MSYAMPEVTIGDLVLWHDNPSSPTDPVMGWVIERPGRDSVSILVFTQNAGFVEKKSVRHRDDPFWVESEMAQNWQRWGCWELHPTTSLLKELKGMVTKAKLEAAKKTKEVAA
jgi:hypothetical protein